jgi:hypothetical protein
VNWYSVEKFNRKTCKVIEAENITLQLSFSQIQTERQNLLNNFQYLKEKLQVPLMCMYLIHNEISGLFDEFSNIGKYIWLLSDLCLILQFT